MRVRARADHHIHLGATGNGRSLSQKTRRVRHGWELVHRYADPWGCLRSKDPLEAAKFVVSYAVFALWETPLSIRDEGFALSRTGRLRRQ